MSRKRKACRDYDNQVVLYMRYSTHNQSDLSFEYQQQEAEKYCETHGYTIVKIFADEAKTGTNDNRENFLNMITEAQNAPRWSKIVVFNNSRFSRNVEDTFCYRSLLKRLGIRVESVMESNDNTPEANLMRSIEMSFDAYLPEKIAEHTHAALKAMAKNGLHCGGVPPLGYDVKDGKLAINEYEAETVKLIFDMYSRNYSYSDMIKVLNEQGRTTKNGTPFKKTSFNSILQQEKYKGVFVWNRSAHKDFDNRRNNHESKPLDEQVRIEGGCEAIVDAEVFDKVQGRMKNNKRSNTSSNGKHHYMFGGMQKVYCAECGALMVGSVYKSHGKSYRYYVCPNHKGGGCSTKNIRALYVENFIVSYLINRTFKRNMVEEYNKLIAEISGNTSCTGLKKELSGVNRAIANLMSVLERSPNDDLIERLEVLNAKKDDIITKINAVKTPPSIGKGDFKEVRKALAHELRHSVDPMIYDLIDKTVDKITVSNDGVEVEMNI